MGLVDRIPFDGTYIPGNRIELLKTGDDLFPALYQMIDIAKERVWLECYIFRDDDIGEKVFLKLKEAVERGVKVHVHLDAIGSYALPATFIEKLKQNGIEILFFHPILRAFKEFSSIIFRRRLHRKVFLVDGNTAIVGGVNIGVEYSTQGSKTAWLDYGVLVQGPVVERLERIMARTWRRSGGRRVNLKPIPISQAMNEEHSQSAEVAIVRNFIVTKFYDIQFNYMSAIRTATQQILLANAYFLPGPLERDALGRAVKRGVNVKVIVPHRSDVWAMKWATRFLYSDLLSKGVEIYEWKPSMMHAKVAVIDDQWCTIGSHNLDYLSKFWNLELNLNFRDPAFCKQVRINLTEELRHCKKLTMDEHRSNHPLLLRVLEWFCYQLVALYSTLGGKVMRRASKSTSNSLGSTSF